MINIDKNLIKFIEITISNQLNFKFSIDNIETQSGGDINQAFKIEGQDQKYFIKLNHRKNLSQFKSELFDLKQLINTNSILVPKPIAVDAFEENSFLILEYIELSTSRNMKNLAFDLASLHRNKNKHYGYKKDNYIGKTKQKNNILSDWIKFFIESRLRIQMELLTQKYEINILNKKIDFIFEIMPNLFQNYKPGASLLHGDLWQGNYGFNQQGKAVIYDPACYYGDHETDLAMMELFSNPGKEFFDCYHQHFPIDKGYPKRRTLYNLYHILNHANMFGGHYLKQAEMMMDQIIDSV